MSGSEMMKARPRRARKRLTFISCIHERLRNFTAHAQQKLEGSAQRISRDQPDAAPAQSDTNTMLELQHKLRLQSKPHFFVAAQPPIQKFITHTLLA